MPATGKHDISLGFRDRILRSALKVFAEYGFHGASTREIARRANVHQPAIAYHFNNKEELWKEAVDMVFSSFKHTLENGLRDIPDHARLERIVDIFVRFVADNPEWAKFVIQEGMQSDERNQWLTKKWLRPQAVTLYEIIFQRKWPASDKARRIQAISMLSALTGCALIFAEQIQVKGIANINTHSPEFIKQHIHTVHTLIQAMLADMNETRPAAGRPARKNTDSAD